MQKTFEVNDLNKLVQDIKEKENLKNLENNNFKDNIRDIFLTSMKLSLIFEDNPISRCYIKIFQENSIKLDNLIILDGKFFYPDHYL